MFATRLRPAAVALAYALVIAAARADDCEDAGRLASMFGQIDQQCPKYRLTRVGQAVYKDKIAESGALGGMKCAEKGKAAMLADLSNPELDRFARSGNQKSFENALCEAVARYLTTLSAVSKTTLIEPR